MTGAMKAYRITVEERFSRGTAPGRLGRGHCYALAFTYLASHQDEPALRLVHGTLHIAGKPYRHAWVELPGRWVFDPADQRFYDRDAYYRVERAVAERVYTVTEAAELALQTTHYGAWHIEDPEDEEEA
jgi:hypothetical protein